MRFSGWMAGVCLALALGATPACANGIREAGAWLAACNNLRACSAFGFTDPVREKGISAGTVYLRIVREGGTDVQPSVSLIAPVGEHSGFRRGRTVRLRLDGRSFEALPEIKPSYVLNFYPNGEPGWDYLLYAFKT